MNNLHKNLQEKDDLLLE